MLSIYHSVKVRRGNAVTRQGSRGQQIAGPSPSSHDPKLAQAQMGLWWDRSFLSMVPGYTHRRASSVESPLTSLRCQLERGFLALV